MLHCKKSCHSKNHRQSSSDSISRWSQVEFNSWSWGWFLRTCSSNNSRWSCISACHFVTGSVLGGWSWGWFLCTLRSHTSRRGRRLRTCRGSYGGSGSSSGAGSSVDRCRRAVCLIGDLETSPYGSVVEWLHGAVISDTWCGVSLLELTQKVHLGKTNRKGKGPGLLSRNSLISPKIETPWSNKRVGTGQIHLKRSCLKKF